MSNILNTNQFEVTVFEITQQNDNSTQNFSEQNCNVCCITKLQSNLNIKCNHFDKNVYTNNPGHFEQKKIPSDKNNRKRKVCSNMEYQSPGKDKYGRNDAKREEEKIVKIKNNHVIQKEVLRNKKKEIKSDCKLEENNNNILSKLNQHECGEKIICNTKEETCSEYNNFNFHSTSVQTRTKRKRDNLEPYEIIEKKIRNIHSACEERISQKEEITIHDKNLTSQ